MFRVLICTSENAENTLPKTIREETAMLSQSSCISKLLAIGSIVLSSGTCLRPSFFLLQYFVMICIMFADASARYCELAVDANLTDCLSQTGSTAIVWQQF